ncbi:hypothetical protein JKP88DRAFT_234192 [Tribonema minus]|uniref:Distal membrane-arm assembly complex protein 1-like domain-containing protein n=1 Tax=Tribonema minus TaxID=303371 RepID=A0A836CJA3_9STRA|nr:hypothetical protein JKP88DRAFT_234192 [Tribonema minus]
MSERPPPQDCLSCKIIGSCTFLGLSGYTFMHYLQTPKAQVGNRMFMAAAAVGFAGVGIARAVWTPRQQPS